MDPGETFEAAAVRELEEETGLVACDIRLLLDSLEAHNTHVKTYRVQRFTGQLRSSSEGIAAWVAPSVLICQGAFPAYTQRLLALARVPYR